MKKLALVFFLCFALPSFALSPAVDKAHKASYQIAQVTVTGTAFCSATAIGPQALLTASHCELPDETVVVRGVGPLDIVARTRDGNDHTILLIKGATFADYVDVALDSLQVTDDVFTIGNPGQWKSIYQRGYVAGVLHKDEGIVILLDLQAFPGASGSGVFNTDGKLVAVLATNEPQVEGELQIDLAGAYPLQFSQKDIDNARAFTTPQEAK